MAKKTATKKTTTKKAPTKKAPTKKAAATTKKKAPAKKKATKKSPAKDESDDKEAPVKKKAAKKKKATRSRTVKEIRLRAFWGVFNQSLKRVAIFEFHERKLADKKASDLAKNGKSPHFVQPVKEVIEG